MSLLRKTALLVAGAGLTAWAVKTAREHKRWFSYAGRTIIVTGGSRGLGLVLARQLVDRGAKVVIAARTKEDLDAARQELEQRGGAVLAVPCDVTSAKQVHELIEAAIGQFGTIDVLINVAGIIEVGPLDAMTDEDFRHAMDTNCWGVLSMVRAVLPTMRKAGWGRIVNIASIGGKRSVPHLLPYCTSKFAVVGLSEGLRAELMRENIFVTTICPSLMRTGSPRNAIFKGKHREEYAWFSIGDSLPVMSMNAEVAAEQILEACQYGMAERLLKNPLNIAISLQSLFPGITREVLMFANRFLPEMGGIGQRAVRGYESESSWSPSALTLLSDEAAERNNEMRLHPVQQDSM
jgi:NAD(P)-dependent dehydrogenase (short-subunit alcohol dehydrogenase family)